MCKIFKAYECLRRALINQERDGFTAFGEAKRERKKVKYFTKRKNIFFSIINGIWETKRLQKIILIKIIISDIFVVYKY